MDIIEIILRLKIASVFQSLPSQRKKYTVSSADQLQTNAFFGTPCYNPAEVSDAMSTVGGRVARKEKINFVTAYLELTLGQ
jgi:hypothetical protein